MKTLLVITFLFTVSIFSFDKKLECNKAVNLLTGKTTYINLNKDNKKILKSMIDTKSKLEKEKKEKDLTYCIKKLTKKEINCINTAKSLYYSKKCLSKNIISKTREQIHKFEIKLLKKLIENINSNESFLKKTQKKLSANKKNKCEVFLFSKNGKNIKITKTCNTKSEKTVFEYYLIILPRNSTKTIYSTYTKIINKKEVTHYDVYSIGSILKGDEHFGKVFDRNGKLIKKDAYKIENMLEQNYISAAF